MPSSHPASASRSPSSGGCRTRALPSCASPSQNGSDSDATLKELGLAYHYNLQNIFLIDLGAKKQYDIGQAAKCLCSTFKDGDGGLVHAGERREFWAWYGLLPGSAKRWRSSSRASRR